MENTVNVTEREKDKTEEVRRGQSEKNNQECIRRRFQGKGE